MGNARKFIEFTKIQEQSKKNIRKSQKIKILLIQGLFFLILIKVYLFFFFEYALLPSGQELVSWPRKQT